MDQDFSDLQVGAFQEDTEMDIIDYVEEEVIVDEIVDEYVDETDYGYEDVVDEYVDEFPDVQPPQPEEPAWQEPVFEEDLTISSVVWKAEKQDWDLGIYKMSDGSHAIGGEDLGVGDIALNCQELYKSGGGSYTPPQGIVGVYYTGNNEALLIKQGNSYVQQRYTWGNQGGYVMAPSTKDVTNQIFSIEDMEGIDFNDDGFIGKPESAEEEIEVSKVLYDDSDGDFDQSLYQMSDGTIVLAEQGLEKNDLPLESQELNGAKNSKLDFSKVVGITWANNGFSIVFNDQGAITQQLVKWGNRGPVLSGKLRAIKDKQVAVLEERMGVDVNKDGRIGNQLSEDAEVQTVIYDNEDGDFDRSLYQLTDGSIVLGEQGLEVNDLPYESEELGGAKDSKIDFSKVTAMMWMNNGFAIFSSEQGIVYQQSAKWGNRGPTLLGKSRLVKDKQISNLEERMGVDINLDSRIGNESTEDPEVERVVFPGNKEFDRGIYHMKSGKTIFAEEDLDVGDTPLEEEPLLGKDGKPYTAGNVVGIAPINDGFAIIEGLNGDYYIQGFKFGNRGPSQYGKSRKIKNVLKLEDKIGYDLTGEGQIGKEDPIIKSVLFNGDDESLYELNDGSLVISDPDVEIGDTPFDLDPLLSGGKNLYKAPDGIVGMVGINNGIGLVFNSGQGYRLQGFKQKGGKYQTIGKPKNISKKLEDYEIDLDLDLNKDNLVGSADSRSGDDGKNPDMDEFIQDLGDGAADLL